MRAIIHISYIFSCIYCKNIKRHCLKCYLTNKCSLYVTVFLGLNSCTFAAKLDESYTRCAESCMKINPYENILRDGASHLVKHCAKLTSDGKCECDWEKVLTPDGDCVCRNPGHKINGNNQCVCDLSKCEEPMKDCKGTLRFTEDPNGCCPVHTCEEDCPSDSYPSNQTQDETCLCYPCKDPNCKENLTTVVLRKGTLQPGTCCDLYKCEDLSQNKTCHWNGKTYWNGDAWLQDECTMYRCENGIIFHDRQEGCEDKFNCFSKGNVFAHEQTWLEDECTNCTCVNGRKKCVAHFCEELPSATIKPRLDDCPSMVTCRKTCAFGFKTNRRGCDLCKCKQPDVKMMQEILHKINCTVEWCDVLRVPPPNRSADNNNVSVEQCPKCAGMVCFLDKINMY